MPLPNQTNPPQLPAALVNWKTSLCGVIPIAIAALDLTLQFLNGHVDPQRVMADLAAFGIGGGLINASDARK